MERDGVAYRVPVRFRSEAYAPGSADPAPIDFDLAVDNAIVLLHDGEMAQSGDVWNAYVTALKAAGPGAAYFPFGSPSGDPPLELDGAARIQYARRDRWEKNLSTREARDARFVLFLLFLLRRHVKSRLDPAAGKDRLFVSHAKADGDATAQAIVAYVNDPGQDVPLEVFYDAKELSPGDDYGDAFDQAIRHGTLLALMSDVYDSRPWCIYEMTAAKRAGRPIVVGDLGRIRTSRTFPYGANVPRVRIKEARDAAEWIEPLLVETLSEGLRCDLVVILGGMLAVAASLADVLVLSRPPELFDLVDRSPLATTVLYPDPPLGQLETEILQKGLALRSPAVRLLTFSEVA